MKRRKRTRRKRSKTKALCLQEAVGEAVGEAEGAVEACGEEVEKSDLLGFHMHSLSRAPTLAPSSSPMFYKRWRWAKCRGILKSKDRIYRRQLKLGLNDRTGLDRKQPHHRCIMRATYDSSCGQLRNGRRVE